MKYTCTLIAVRDMEKAKQFYHDVLGLEVVADFGANVTLTGGIALQTVDSWRGFIHKPYEEITFGNNACELYFEEDDMDTFAAKLKRIKNIYRLDSKRQRRYKYCPLFLESEKRGQGVYAHRVG